MYNALAASAVLPYHQPHASIVDVRSRLQACAFDERQAWEALQLELLHALRLHSREIHLDCESDGLRMRTNTPNGTVETRLPADDALLKALRLLESQPWSSKAASTYGSAWFLARLEKRDHFFQLDHVQSSSGSSYTLRRLYDAQNPIPQLDGLLKLRGQANYIRDRLQQTNGLILLADVDRVRRITTARALAQCMTSPTRRILLSESACHPLVPGTNQIILPLDTDNEHHQAWRQACDMSYDIIIALEITHDPVRLTRLATENCQVVQGVCANSASNALAQLLATGTRPEAIARALTSIIVQHQIALACERCKCPATVSDELNDWIAERSPMHPGGINDWLTERLSDNFVQADGCEFCNNTGVGEVRLLVECISLSSETQDALNDSDIRYATASLEKSDQFSIQLISLARSGAITVDHAINRFDEVRRRSLDNSLD